MAPKSCFLAVVVRRSCGYNSEIKNERGEMWCNGGKRGARRRLGAPRLNILNGLFAAGEAAQRRSMSAPAAPQKEHRTADRAQEKRCVPPANAACAPCTRDRTGGAQARPGALWSQRAGGSGRSTPERRQPAEALHAASPSPASWGSARPPPRVWQRPKGLTWRPEPTPHGRSSWSRSPCSLPVRLRPRRPARRRGSRCVPVARARPPAARPASLPSSRSP